MRHRTKLKAILTRKFLRTMPATRSIRAKHVNVPFQIMVDDILTGYIGEKMHQELLQLKQAKKRKWND